MITFLVAFAVAVWGVKMMLEKGANLGIRILGNVTWVVGAAAVFLSLVMPS